MLFTALAIALTAASAGAQAAGAINAAGNAKKAGRAEQDAANSQASLDEYNATVADSQAQDAVSRGQIAETRFRQQTAGIIGGQRTAAAAGNVDANFGSAMDVQRDASFLGEQDALTIRANAAREAAGYTVQATNLRREADIARKTGRYQAQAGQAAASADYAQAAAGALGAGASILQMKYGFKSPTSTPVKKAA